MMESASRWNPDPTVEVLVDETPWRLSGAVYDAVESAWQEYRRQFFRGPVLTVVRLDRVEHHTRIATRWTDYAHFLYSSRHLQPTHPDYVRVLFAAGCVVTADQHLLLAVMGPKASRAGWIQAIGGSPDPEEVDQGRFDPVASVVREVREETGWDLKDPDLAYSMRVVGHTVDGKDQSVAVAVLIRLKRGASEALREFREFQRQNPDGELSDLVAVPLGPVGRDLLQQQSRRVVRYLEPVIMAPEFWGA